MTKHGSSALGVLRPYRCLGKYVVVKHEGWPYAGFVEDIDFYEGHMDALGKNVANNIYSGRNKFRGHKGFT